ncbi:uncharacterized protein JCM6883_005891 [Sporobolomyces salmoneus]|uniref:uncharacterized protein n=1 Tax=Sporobolomyces salmoneus TaxID=183962 RepID=UPI003180C0EB
MASLGPAFNYSPSTSRSLPFPRSTTAATHAPNPSLSSLATTSSGNSNRSSYTSYTSSYCSHRDSEEDQEEEEDDDRSILEDLLDNLSREDNEDDEGSPPRIPLRDSSQQLRERTRYRSSASIQPLAAPSSSVPPSSSMDLSSFLASLPPSLDKCFCGKDVEEDSIYCSRLCAQEDALNALCGASSGAEDSDRASLVSGSSGSAASQSGESHYRRVEREEVRREKERQAKLARERAVARRRAREGESVSSAGSTGSAAKKGSLWRNNVDVGSVKTASTSSSNRVGTPSLSSSVSSIASTSSTSSPISPSFPRSIPQHHPDLAHLPTPVILAPPPRPTTPSPPSPLRDVSDIYSSYLATTPLAASESKFLRTPRQNDGSTPRSAYPQTPYDDDEEDDSPTGRAARLRAQQQQSQQSSGACGVSDVGLRMLELCSSYPSSPSEDFLSESLDHVNPGTPSLGWGHREMQERMTRKQGKTGGSSGHTKGKLSFEDVVGILGN